MGRKKYVVELLQDERTELLGKISKGKSSAQGILKARILLKADQGLESDGWTDERICLALETNVSMVSKTRAKFVMEGLEAVFSRKKRATPAIQPIFDGEAQAKLTALACSTPPKGHARWTLRLLSERVVALEIVEKAHFNTVGRALKKTNSSRI